MANTEIDPFAYNPAAAASVFGALPPQAAPEEVDISQYLPQAQPMQGRSSSYDEAFQQAESQYGLPSGLLSTIGFHESRFNPNAVSPAGAEGLMQLMPPTAKEYGVNARDPYASIDAAGKKMAGLVKYYNGDMAKAVAAYNYGEGNLNRAIRKAGDNWISAVPRETQFYVSKVLGGQPQGQEAQGPQEDTYPIPLASGRTLYAPKGMPREEALASARAQGVDAVGLRDISLASGKTLQVPEHLTDEEAIKQASEAHPDIDFTLAKKDLGPRTTGGFFKDVGATTLKGVTSLAQSVIGLADIITPGDLGAAVENNVVDLSKYQDYLDKQFSPQTQEAIKNLNEAHGLGNILQAAKENPSAVLSMVGQAIPQMVGAAGPAKAALYGLGKLSTKATPAIASAIENYGAYGAAGAGEGLLGAGGAKENLREINPEGEATGVNTLAALGTGAGTALFGAVGSKATTALGGVDPTVMFMGGLKKAAVDAVGDVATTPGFFKSTLVSMVGEGVLEEAPQSAVEQMFQNYATNSPLFGGVPDSAFKGAVIGALMGGGANVGSRIAAPPTPTPEVKVPEVKTPEVKTGKLLPSEIEVEEKEPVVRGRGTLFTPEDEAILAERTKGKKEKQAVEQVVAGAPAAEQVVAGAPAVEEVVPEPTVKAKKEKPVKIEPIPTPEIQNAQQIPSPSPIVRDGGTQPQEGQAVENIPQAGEGVEPSRQGEPIAQKGAEEEIKPAVSQLMADTANLALEKYKEKPISKNIGNLRKVAEALELPVSIKTPHAEVYDQVAKAIGAPVQPLTKWTQTPNIQPAATVATPTEKPVKGLNAVQKRYKEHIVNGTLDEADDAVKDLNNALRTSDPLLWDSLQKAHTQAKQAKKAVAKVVAETARVERVQKVAEREKLETPPATGLKAVVAKATKRTPEDIRAAVERKKALDAQITQELQGVDTTDIEPIAELAPTIKESGKKKKVGKVQLYDEALDKADDVSLEEDKKSARPFIKSMIKQGLLTEGHLKGYENIFKDKDMGIDDIMSEVRADLEAGRESATAKATDELKYESLSSQEAVVSKAIDRTIKKEKAEELKVFDIPEKKIQLFAARKKAHALLEAGKISQEDFIRRSEQITDEERVRHAEAAFKRNPRARGADYVREKLLNALRKGDVSQEEHDFAEWFIKKNPNALENLGISIKATPEGKGETAGNYTPLNQVVTLFKGHNKDTTAVHEILHHLERAMPEQIQKGIRRAWLKQTVDAREKAIKNKADKSIVDYYDAVLLGEPKAARDALMKVKKGRDELYHHLNASEFWAVNATDIMQGKYGADANFIAKLKQWLKEAHEHIKHALGLNSNAPVLKAIDHVLKNIDTDYTSKKMLAERTKGIIYAAPPSGPSKAAKDLGKTIVDEGLVKTSDKKPIDSVKEGFELAKKHGTLTKLATGWIDSSRGLSRALSELDSMDVKGEMRADLIHSKLQQIYNLVRECFSEGYLVLSGDGGLMTKLDKSLALEHIFKRIDALGYPDSRKTFFSVMRVLAGESNLRHDAEQRALAKRYTDYIRVRQKDVENLEGGIVDAKRAKNKVAVAQLQKDLRELNSKLSAFKAEAKRIYDRVGKKSLVDIEADIARKEAVAQKKEALAAATADATMKDKLNKEASDLRDSIERLSSKIEGTGVGTEKRVTQEQIDIVKELLANDDRLEPIMADIYTALRKSVDLWEETGLIDADTADNWRDNPAYIPLYKSMDDKETDDMLNDPSKYVQMLMVGAKSEAKVHAREGGLHDVNVGENLVKHFAFMAGAAAQNQYRKIAAKHLEVVGVAKEIPTKINGKEVTPDDPQAVMFKEDGKKVYYHVSDPVAFEAFQTMIPVLGSFSKAAQHYTKFFRTATLVNPVYWYRQLIRDPLHANLVSRTGTITPLHAMKAFAEILTDRSGTYKTLKRHGVVGAVDSISDPKQFVKAAALERGVVRKSADWVMRVHEAADAATRVAIFDKAIEEATKKGITGQHAENFAAMRAREIINFSKKGNAQQIAAIRATVPFFSSQLNAMDTLARAAFPGKYGNLNKVEAAEAKKHFYANAAMLVTASMAFALVMQDDEEYQKSPDWVDNWLIPTGDKENPFWKIPIPFEAGFLFKVIPEAIIRMLSGTLTYNQGMKSITDAGNRLLIPSLPIPQILKPIAEVVANHDYHTGNPIENYSESRLPKEQRTAHASELSKLLGEALPISPDNIEHLGRGWATGAWAMSAALADAFLNKGVSAPEKAWSETYLGKGVLSKGHTDRALSEFYSAATGASQIHNAVMAANKMGDRDTVDAIKNDPDKLKQFKASPALQDIGTSISAMQHNIKRIKVMKDTEVSPAEKAKRIRVVQDRINNLAQKALVVGKRFDLDI